MKLVVLSPRMLRWRRVAQDMRVLRNIALATVQTYLAGKGLSTAEVTAVVAGLPA